MGFCLLIHIFALQMLLASSAYPAMSNTFSMWDDRVAEGEKMRAKKIYNRLMVGTCMAFEQALGTWKARFPMMLGVLCYKILKCVTLILASMTMHNFIVKTGGGWLENLPEEAVEGVNDDVGPEGPGAADIENCLTMNAITEVVYNPFCDLFILGGTQRRRRMAPTE